jgi:hypothetical protein
MSRLQPGRTRKKYYIRGRREKGIRLPVYVQMALLSIYIYCLV